MRTLNLDPFWRTSIGFDRLFDLVDQSLRFEPEDHYPPCNIVRTGENTYRISLAVAGFKPEQIAVTLDQNTLVVTGQGSSGYKIIEEFLPEGCRLTEAIPNVLQQAFTSTIARGLSLVAIVVAEVSPRRIDLSCELRMPIENRHPSIWVSRSSTPNIFMPSKETAYSSFTTPICIQKTLAPTSRDSPMRGITVSARRKMSTISTGS